MVVVVPWRKKEIKGVRCVRERKFEWYSEPGKGSKTKKRKENMSDSATAMAAEGSSSSGNGGRNSAAVQRLLSDLREMHDEPPEGCSAAPVSDSNLFVWNASIIGPNESPWEGGIFSLRLQFSEKYPSEPPRVRFTCEMFHPNVYADGALCLDIIQDQWSPIYTTSTILTSIQSLLTDPNPNSPANTDAAKLFTTDPKLYRKRVRKIAARSLES